MAITKPSVRDAWADQALVNDISDPGNSYVAAGWTPSGVKPIRQYMNWILNWLANGIRYFSRRGIADYDAAETYSQGDITRGNDGLLYESLQNSNTNNTPSTSPLQWGSIGVPTPASNDNSSNVPNTSWVVTYAVKVGTALSAQPGQVTSGQVPLGAVQQYQFSLQINWGQIQGVKNADQLLGRVPVTAVFPFQIPTYDSSGYLYAEYFNQASVTSENGAISQLFTNNGGDNYLRKSDAWYVLTQMMLSSAVTLAADPGGTPANGVPGSLVAYF